MTRYRKAIQPIDLMEHRMIDPLALGREAKDGNSSYFKPGPTRLLAATLVSEIAGI